LKASWAQDLLTGMKSSWPKNEENVSWLHIVSQNADKEEFGV
jgi:hypothetical protein